MNEIKYKKSILHIVNSDKFTFGYIKYMLKNIKQCNHKFIVKKSSYINIGNYYIKKYIIIIDEKSEIIKYKELLRNSDKIIISGVFGFEKYLFLLSNKILKKSYLHFWGGDFYSYRNTRILSKNYLKKIIMHSCIKRCAGIVNLIEDDYNELSKIFPNNNNHYVMIMPDNPKNINICDNYLKIKPDGGKILLGNSATPENCHIEILEKLKHLKDKDIKIICPLSYGSREYANKVIDIGKEIYGDKFVPITEYMKYEDYLSLIASCSVAIFNNNRQQAMGNINFMLTIGRKVYIKETTPMWNEYTKYGVLVNNTNILNNISYNELFNFDDKISDKNKKCMKERQVKMYKTIDDFFDIILND